MGSRCKELEDTLLIHVQDTMGSAHGERFPLSYVGSKDNARRRGKAKVCFLYEEKSSEAVTRMLLIWG